MLIDTILLFGSTIVDGIHDDGLNNKIENATPV